MPKTSMNAEQWLSELEDTANTLQNATGFIDRCDAQNGFRNAASPDAVKRLVEMVRYLGNTATIECAYKKTEVTNGK